MPADPNHVLARIKAVPQTRRLLLPDRFSADDAGRVGTDVLRLSAESDRDILLLLPPTGVLAAGLSLGEVLSQPGTAPTIGLLCGSAATSMPILLQCCALRVLSKHARLAPTTLFQTHTVAALLFSGPEEQTARTLEALDAQLFTLTRLQALMMKRVGDAIGSDVVTLQAVLDAKPDFSAGEAVAAGWADACV